MIIYHILFASETLPDSQTRIQIKNKPPINVRRINICNLRPLQQNKLLSFLKGMARTCGKTITKHLQVVQEDHPFLVVRVLHQLPGQNKNHGIQVIQQNVYLDKISAKGNFLAHDTIKSQGPLFCSLEKGPCLQLCNQGPFSRKRGDPENEVDIT